MPPPVPSPLPAAASPAAPAPEGRGAPDDWTGLCTAALPTDVEGWATEPRCGAVVSFRGTVRDHAEGRTGVEQLTYEAYEDVAVARLDELVAAARGRWPGLGRIAVLHRVGRLAVTDTAVLVVVAAGHRTEAFEAGRWLIDAVKATVPIWKHERWADGDGWGTGAQPLADVGSFGAPADGAPADRAPVEGAGR